MRILSNIYALRLRDLRPYVKALTLRDAKSILDKDGWKVENINIQPGAETRWQGTILFRCYPVGVLFEFDSISLILKHMAALSLFVNSGE